MHFHITHIHSHTENTTNNPLSMTNWFANAFVIQTKSKRKNNPKHRFAHEWLVFKRKKKSMEKSIGFFGRGKTKPKFRQFIPPNYVANERKNNVQILTNKKVIYGTIIFTQLKLKNSSKVNIATQKQLLFPFDCVCALEKFDSLSFFFVFLSLFPTPKIFKAAGKVSSHWTNIE